MNRPQLPLSTHEYLDYNYLIDREDRNQTEILTFYALQSTKIITFLQSLSFPAALVGTIPIKIAIESSDLDIIVNCPLNRQDELIDELEREYSNYGEFKIKKEQFQGQTIVMCHFIYVLPINQPGTVEHSLNSLPIDTNSAGRQFEIEIFAQDCELKKQNGYMHMIKEAQILDHFRQLEHGLNSEYAQTHDTTRKNPQYQTLTQEQRDIVNASDIKFRDKVICLKTMEIKTEPAFALLLDLPGDNPYSSLLDYEPGSVNYITDE